MFRRALLLSSFLVSLAKAQDDAAVSTVANGIASTTLQMRAVGLIPDPVPAESLDLKAVLSLDFGTANSDVATGQSLSIADVQTPPRYKLQYADPQDDQLDGATFTVLFLDAGAAGVGNPDGLLTRHFLGNNFKLGDDAVLTNSTPAITEYAAPLPAAGSGPHRYFQVIALQPNDFQAPANLSNPGTPLSTMSLEGYINESKLGKIVSASFVVIENNQQASSTDSVSSTQAVPSASIQAFATSVSSSLQPTGTNAGTNGGAGGGSSEGNNGAGSFKPLGAAAALLIVGAAAVLL